MSQPKNTQPVPFDADCRHCRWFELDGDLLETGTCHRHAPIVVATGFGWPQVLPSHQCGDWDLRLTKAQIRQTA